MPLAIGVDIGGTKVAAGVVDDEGRVIDTERRRTPSNDVDETEQVIAEVVDDLVKRHDVVAVGIGAAGWISNDRATVLFSPHLAWRNEPLRDALADRIGQPVTVENDANAAAWAEYRFGAAQGARVVVCVTLGTGIGGGLVVSGVLYRGCWEMYASGTALARDARELADISPVAAHRLLELAGGDPDALTGLLVTQAAQEGDPAAVEIYTAMGQWLGRGLANLAAIIDPEVFVIGGGLSEAGNLLILPARETFQRSLTGRGFRPVAEVKPAQLGPDAGLVGAADLGRRRV